MKISYADELGRLLTVLKPADYDLLRPVKYLNYKKSPLTGLKCFRQVQLTEGAAFYHVFKFGGIRKDVVWRYLPGEQTEIPDYLFYDWLAFKTGKKYSYILFGWSETAKTNRKGLWVVDFAANGKVNFNPSVVAEGIIAGPLSLFSNTERSKYDVETRPAKENVLFSITCLRQSPVCGLFHVLRSGRRGECSRIEKGRMVVYR